MSTPYAYKDGKQVGLDWGAIARQRADRLEQDAAGGDRAALEIIARREREAMRAAAAAAKKAPKPKATPKRRAAARPRPVDTRTAAERRRAAWVAAGRSPDPAKIEALVTEGRLLHEIVETLGFRADTIKKAWKAAGHADVIPSRDSVRKANFVAGTCPRHPDAGRDRSTLQNGKTRDNGCSECRRERQRAYDRSAAGKARRRERAEGAA